MSPVLSAYLSNIAQTAAGVALILLISAPVGIAALRLMLRISGEHPRLAWHQIPVAAAVGMLLVPFALNMLGLLIGGVMRPIWLIVCSAVLFIALMSVNGVIRRPLPDPPTRRHSLMLAAISAAAVLTLTPLLSNGTPADVSAREWRIVGTGDYSKHFAIISILAIEDDLPPPNPFVVTDPALRYYYNFYILPAAAMRLSQHFVSVANAYTAASMLAAAVFPFVLFELARRLGASTSAALIAAALATLVGGVDVIYMLLTRLESGVWPDHIDLWSPVDERRVSSIPTMFIWTPQHVLALIGFMLVIGFLAALLQNRPRSASVMIGASVLIGGIAGTSIYVWIGLIGGLALFTLVEMLRTRRLSFEIILPSTLGLLVSAPVLILLSGRDAPPPLIAIAQPPDGLRYGAIFTRLLGTHQFAYLLDFPAHMLLEMGAACLLGLAALWTMRRRWPSDSGLRLCVSILVAATVILLLLRDPEGRNNDFALRVSPIVWIMLTVLVGMVWSHRSGSRLWQSRAFQGAAALMVVLGLASTVYEVVIRLTTPDSITADEHDLYQWLNANLAATDIYQIGRMGTHNALVTVEKRIAAGPSHINYLYAAEPAAVTAMFNLLSVGYDSNDPAAAARGFHELGIRYVVADDTELSILLSEYHPEFPALFELVYKNHTYRVYRLRE